MYIQSLKGSWQQRWKEMRRTSNESAGSKKLKHPNLPGSKIVVCQQQARDVFMLLFPPPSCFAHFSSLAGTNGCWSVGSVGENGTTGVGKRGSKRATVRSIRKKPRIMNKSGSKGPMANMKLWKAQSQGSCTEHWIEWKEQIGRIESALCWRMYELRKFLAIKNYSSAKENCVTETLIIQEWIGTRASD